MPERSAMEQFCDFLRNIVDRNIAKSQNRKVESSLHYIIVLSLYCEIAISQIAGMLCMTIFVNLFYAKCDLAIDIIAYWKIEVFQCELCELR